MELGNEPDKDKQAAFEPDSAERTDQAEVSDKSINTEEVEKTDEPSFSSGQPVVSEPKRRVKKKSLIFIIVLLALAGGAAAYLLTKKDTSAPAPTAVRVKKDVPLIRIGMRDATVNSIYPDSQNIAPDYEINEQIFEGLVKYENQTQIAPALATGWSNPDNSTWVFKLRPGVKFHTGNALTANDVKNSIEYIQKNNEVLASFASTIKSVEATDKSTVTIKTKGTDPVLLNKLAFLYIFDSAPDKADVLDRGAGPYKIKAGTKPTENLIQLVANDNYYGGHVYTRQLEYSMDDADKQVAKFKAGKLEILDNATLADVKALPDYPSYSTQDPYIYYLVLNQAVNSPLQKLQVRQAINYAIDRQAAAKALTIPAVAADQILPQTIPGYDKSIETPTRDISKAKELLKQAGYPNGVTIPVEYGNTFPEVPKALAEQLKEAGITLQLSPLANKEFFDKVLSGKSNAFLMSYGSDYLDGADVFTNFVQSIGGYKNPKLDGLLADSNRNLDPAARLKTMQSISQLMADEVPVIPIYKSQRILVFKKSYKVVQDVTHSETNLAYWKLYQD